ncbi:MAG: pyridoxamine 5'-phosphate oxidase family protein [Alphaproteobacteria bacterium]|nr:pyridoxamine 5'-phosphate oxidase family protein [Alphaproteobacteria bacterium]
MGNDGTARPGPVAGPVADETGLRALYDAPSELARLKQLDRLDKHCRNFIAHSPFLVIGTTRPGHGTDCSPRGDAPGFVQVIDDRTLVIPDRPGNNRLDTMSNLTHAPEVGLIFLIPGVDETLRVNGRASLTRDPAVLAKAAVNGKAPKLAIQVEVREAFLHCGKALKRSRLWSQDYKVDAKTFPSLGRMIVEQVKPQGITVEEADRRVEDGYKNRLY